MSTYLELTNKVLNNINEEPLTSTDFNTYTRGVQSVAKDAVRYSVSRIQQEETLWPFNYVEPAELLLTVGDQYYDLETDLAGTPTIDQWDVDNVLVKKDTTLDVSATPLKQIDWDLYKTGMRYSDLNLVAAGYSLPRYVIRAPNKKLVCSTVPDKAYTLLVPYWSVPAELSTFSDTVTVPERFDWVITTGALIRMYMHRQNAQAVRDQEEAFMEAIRVMRTSLINIAYSSVSDTRSSAAISSNSNWRGSENYINS